MKLLLCKNVNNLGIVGDVVQVSAGYGRNYLLPQGLATEPTEGNMRVLAKARREAEHERARQRTELEKLAERLAEVEVTIHAPANESGVLYGSVGPKEIAAALADEGYFLQPDQIVLVHPIRQLDNVEVEVKLAADLPSSIKVWVVRDKTDEEDEEGGGEEASDRVETGTEAGGDGYQTSD